jgi:hypothetical protein
MKRYVFHFTNGFVGCDAETEEDFDDDVTEKELEEYLDFHIDNHTEAWWEEVDSE